MLGYFFNSLREKKEKVGFSVLVLVWAFLVIIGKVKLRAHTINILKHGFTGEFLESFPEHHYAFHFGKIIFSLETTADLRQREWPSKTNDWTKNDGGALDTEFVRE